RTETKEQQRILRRNLADLLEPAINDAERHQADQPLEHDHPNAGQVVGQLLEGDDAKTLKGRAFTPHDAPPLSLLPLPEPWTRSNACRWRRGLALGRRDISGGPASPPLPPRPGAVPRDRPATAT